MSCHCSSPEGRTSLYKLSEPCPCWLLPIIHPEPLRVHRPLPTMNSATEGMQLNIKKKKYRSYRSLIKSPRNQTNNPFPCHHFTIENTTRKIKKWVLWYIQLHGWLMLMRFYLVIHTDSLFMLILCSFLRLFSQLALYHAKVFYMTWKWKTVEGSLYLYIC